MLMIQSLVVIVFCCFVLFVHVLPPLLFFLVAVIFRPVEFPFYPLVIVLLAPSFLLIIVVLLVPLLLLGIVILLVPSLLSIIVVLLVSYCSSSSPVLGHCSSACHMFRVSMLSSFKRGYIVHISRFSGILQLLTRFISAICSVFLLHQYSLTK